MNFSNGCWLQKEGCACFSPAEVSFTRVEEAKATLVAPTSHILKRGDTLGGVNLTVEISCPAPEVIRVKAFHYMGAREDGPAFELAMDEGAEVSAEDGEERLVIRNGSLRLEIEKNPWHMAYYWEDTPLCASGKRDLAYIKTDWKGDMYVKSGDKDAYMRQRLSLGVGELVKNVHIHKNRHNKRADFSTLKSKCKFGEQIQITFSILFPN